MKWPRILLTEADESLRREVKRLLLREAYEVVEVTGVAETLHSCRALRPDLVLIGSPADRPTAGVAVARQIRTEDRRLPVILIVRESSEEHAIAALRAGVNDYFRTSGSLAEVVRGVARCLADVVAREPTATDPPSGLVHGQHMIGESRVIRDVKLRIARVAASDSTVLITGETGTGKELTADLIHGNSARRRRPLVSINCAAIPEHLIESELFGFERGAFTGATAARDGKLRVADRGTAFFDEIAEMSVASQAKLLRVIETRTLDTIGARGSIPLDVRVIAATNQDLEHSVTEGRFRKDLYFRLNVARIHLPPLRERREDIPLLLAHSIGELNRQFRRDVEGFTDEALDELLRYGWPGNVRELRNVLEAIFVNLPPRRIAFVDLPDEFRRRLGGGEALPRDERERLLKALFANRWNKSEAARQLQWSRMTVYRKIAKYHLTRGGAPGTRQPESHRPAV